MGYIYKITCNTTNKIYIGKTEISVAHRWKEHCKASFLPSHKDYDLPIHRAIRKYGVENFIIEEIDYTKDNEELKQKEIYWINFYDSYNSGYNATLGGDGQCKYNYNDIVNYYLSHGNSLLETCKYFNIYDQVVYCALKSKNIDYKNLKSTSNIYKNKYNKPILLVEKNILFKKMSDIDRFFNKSAHPNVRRCLNGRTEKAYGYHWKEIDENEDTTQYICYE